jgi:ribulose-phosphate 3-epimerase
MIKIAPSLLSADFSHLADEIKSIESADWLHFDVMDGVFVPNISIGLPVLEAVRKITEMPLDVHLMITEPWRYVRNFVDAGADIITVHLESCSIEHVVHSLRTIRSLGKRAGLSIKPSTPPERLIPFLFEADVVLVMTVEPGFGGQTFMYSQMPKLRALRDAIELHNLPILLEVDGGVNPETAKVCVQHGADVLVAGSDIFKSQDRAARIRQLRGETYDQARGENR